MTFDVRSWWFRDLILVVTKAFANRTFLEGARASLLLTLPVREKQNEQWDAPECYHRSGGTGGHHGYRSLDETNFGSTHRTFVRLLFTNPHKYSSSTKIDGTSLGRGRPSNSNTHTQGQRMRCRFVLLRSECGGRNEQSEFEVGGPWQRGGHATGKYNA
jgi:hypothetical protein